MTDDKNPAPDQSKIDDVVIVRTQIDKFKASTAQAETKADQELRRSLELNSSFYDKLAALNSGSIAVAVTVAVALLATNAPHSAFLHTNIDWLVAIAFFLWSSLICAIGHNAQYVKIARLESERAKGAAAWIGLINADLMQTITQGANSKVAQSLDTMITDQFHDRIQKGALNLHRTEQAILRAAVLGYGAVYGFLIAYTLVFICIIRIWWITR